MPTTEGALDMKLDLSQMIDGYTGSEHSLPIQPLYKDVTQFVARTHTFYTRRRSSPMERRGRRTTTSRRRTCTRTRRCAGSSRTSCMTRWSDGAPVVPAGGIRAQGIAKGVADIVRAGGRAGLGSHGQVPGTRCALGDLGSAVRRAHAARDAARGNALRAPSRSGWRRTSARSSRAGWRICSCSTRIRSSTSTTRSRSAM